MVVANNGCLLSDDEVDSIKLLREIYIKECNLDICKFAIMILRLRRANTLKEAKNMAENIRSTFTWID